MITGPEATPLARWAAIESAVMERATKVSLASRLHGPAHWRAVGRVGVALAKATPGADIGLVLLFALVHDSQRRNDGRDPEHGRRAASLARELAAAGTLDLAPADLERLCLACAGHADGKVDADPTIGACWDADRLNLWRCWVRPARRLLSTEAARSAAIYDWSESVHVNPPSWATIIRELESASAAPVRPAPATDLVGD